MKLDENCCLEENGSIVQRDENGKIFRLKNKDNKKVNVCRVDGCLIKDNTKKCDFIFVVDDDKLLYLVEMKGKDHVHALRQIIATAETLNIKNFSGNKKSAIVGSPSPKVATTYQNELVKLKKRFKASGLSYPEKKNNKIEKEC